MKIVRNKTKFFSRSTYTFTLFDFVLYERRRRYVKRWTILIEFNGETDYESEEEEKSQRSFEFSSSNPKENTMKK